MIKRYLIALTLVFALIASFGLPIMAADGIEGKDTKDKELVSLRTENTKTFSNGNGQYRIEASVGAIHYKDDYSNPSEAWKDIDLTWEGNRITKAPYELTLDNDTLTLRDKKTGQVSTITPLPKDGKPKSLLWRYEDGKATELTRTLGNNLEILISNTSVSFRQSIYSWNLPFEESYRVTGTPVLSEVSNKQYYLEGNEPVFTTKAYDDEGLLRLETTFENGVLTERMNTVVDDDTGKVRALKGTIRIDPTWQVGASTDDCFRRSYASGAHYFSTTYGVQGVGYYQADHLQWGGGMRFTNITIPPLSEIDAGTYLSVKSNAVQVYNNIYSYISAEGTDDAATFSTVADFNTRYATRTSDNVSWGPIEGFTVDNTWYNSPEIQDVIQEVVDRGGWLSGNDLVIFWDDFTDRSTHTDFRIRQGDCYDTAGAEPPKLVIEYTPPLDVPTVTNSAADNITQTTADFHGDITSTGGENPATRGFVWDTDSGLPYSDNWTENGDFGTGAFDHNMTGLPSDSPIFWRAFATNSEGIGYSAESSFNTLPPLPLEPDNLTITKTGVNSISVIWDLGLYADNVTFRIQEDSYPTSMTDGYELFSGNGTSTTKDGLNLGTSTYYISGWCSNETGDSVDYAQDNIGGENMVWLFIVAIVGILSWVSVSRRQPYLGFMAAIGWVFLLVYTRDNPIPGIAVGTFADTLIILMTLGMAVGLLIMSFMSYNREKSLANRGYAVSESGHIAGSERTSNELSPEEEYRAKVRKALHPKKRR